MEPPAAPGAQEGPYARPTGPQERKWVTEPETPRPLPLGSVRHHHSVRKQNQGEGCGNAGQSGGSLLHLQQGTWVQGCDEVKEGPGCGSVTKPMICVRPLLPSQCAQFSQNPKPATHCPRQMQSLCTLSSIPWMVSCSPYRTQTPLDWEC